MKKIILLFIFVSTPLFSKTISKCGVYSAEGYYTKIKSVLHKNKMKDVILLNRGSNSEIIYYIQNKEISKLIPKTHVGVNFKLELVFNSKCNYHCAGKIKKVISPIDPFKTTKQFTFPVPKPQKGTEFKCKKSTLI